MSVLGIAGCRDHGAPARVERSPAAHLAASSALVAPSVTSAETAKASAATPSAGAPGEADASADAAAATTDAHASDDATITDGAAPDATTRPLPPPTFAAARGAGTVAAATVDSPLACLAAVYHGTTLDGPSGPALGLGSHVFAVDDGKTKSADDRFEEPDLRDVFRVPYVRKPIAKIEDPEEDPGRIRHEPLLRAVYGEDQLAIERQLVPFPFFDNHVRVHKLVIGPFERVRARLQALVASDPSLAKFFVHIGGTYNYRKIAGSYRTSAHAFGIALDLSVTYSHYWRNETGSPRWKNLIPSAIVEAFEAEGFVWGGRWYHYDTMHFEYRPEFFDPACVRH